MLFFLDFLLYLSYRSINKINSMEKFNYYHHHPVTDEFESAGNVYLKVKESDSHYLFKVTTDTGLTFYELFEKKKYSSKSKTFVSSTLNEGDYMYPTDKDFGYWAWCYSKFDYAIEKWNLKTSNL